MQMNDMILVSVDDHIVEPPDMFKHHTPAAYKDRTPRQIHKDGLDVWVFEDVVIPNIALNAVAGRRPEEYGMEPTAMDQLRKGTYDLKARIDDMNVNGVLGSLNFPSFPGVAGQKFINAKDKALALAVIQSYNDWHIDEWCGSYPGRFIPCGIVPLWDPKLAADEVRRIKKKGCNAISFTPNPSLDGLPSLHNEHWDPLWAACDSEAVTICTHISDATGAVPSPDSPVDVFITNMPVSLYANAADLLWSPVLRKFKNIRFALSEGGAGWVPHFLERADYVYKHHHLWTRQNFGDKLPSQVFLEHCYTCFIDDKTALAVRHAAGLDNMTWECDYPHSDSTWPNSPEILWEGMKDLPDSDIDKITHLNAMKCYDYAPFKHIKRENCTVGALRAQARHVDLTPLDTKGAGRPPGESASGPVTMIDVRKQLSASVGLKIKAAE